MEKGLRKVNKSYNRSTLRFIEGLVPHMQCINMVMSYGPTSKVTNLLEVEFWHNMIPTNM